MPKICPFAVVFLLWTHLVCISGQMNLYMNATEAKRVLGIQGSFYFIQNDEIKVNAVKYNMRVPRLVKCLGFTWHRDSTPTTYSILVESLTPELLSRAKLQGIPPTGQVPQNPKNFCLRFECRGVKEGTARVQMNITLLVNTRVSTISFIRTKSCRRVVPVGTPPVSHDPSKPGQTQTGDKGSFSTSEKTKVFYIAVGVACSVILIIALAVAAVHVHSIPSPSKNKDGTSVSEGSSAGQGNLAKSSSVKKPLLPIRVNGTAGQQPQQATNDQAVVNNASVAQTNHVNQPHPNHIPVQVEINQLQSRNKYVNQIPGNQIPGNQIPGNQIPGNPLPNGEIPTSRTMSVSSNATTFPNRTTSVSSAPVSELYPHAGGLVSTQRGKYGNRDIKAELANLVVDMSRITLGDLLYEGTFARIYEGVLTGPEEHQQQGVIVKTVCEIASPDQVNLMLVESSMLRDLTHKNLLPVMSVCLEDEEMPLVMFPFMNKGNLKLYLKRSRSPEGISKSLTTADLLLIGIQIAKGMQYLARRGIVHKDVAARNCVLDDELNVKVTDCALSRDLFPGDYCCLCDNENRPVKWMAVESLESNRYTVASDVWSYGVLLWELMTLALQPYANIDAFEMLNFLKKGHRIAQPINCPDELFTVIACCWALSEDDRPSFGQLIACLTEFNNALSNFI